MPTNKQTKRVKDITSSVILIAGIVLILYPVLSTLQNNYDQNKLVEKTWNTQIKGDNSIYQKELKQAEEYNNKVAYGPIFDPFLKQVVPDTNEYKEYLENLNLTQSMGAISIPKIKLSLPIYHGTSDDILDKGVGHLYGSSLPVGGPNTKTILTAHSGLSSATMFDNIRDLKPGDPIFLQIHTRKLKYEVTGQKVILPTETKELRIHPGEDTLVLITCTPYGINTHRLLVFAKQVPLTQEESAKLNKPPVNSPWQKWMLLSLILILVTLAAYYRLSKNKKPLHNKPQPLTHSATEVNQHSKPDTQKKTLFLVGAGEKKPEQGAEQNSAFYLGKDTSDDDFSPP